MSVCAHQCELRRGDKAREHYLIAARRTLGLPEQPYLESRAARMIDPTARR